MDISEFVPTPITKDRLATLNEIARANKEPCSASDLPHGSVILEEVYYEPKDPNNPKDKPGEVINAKKNSNYIGLKDNEFDKKLDQKIPELVADCLTEMGQYETISREPAEERLKKLKEIAPTITRIIDLSAPGDYYHLNKNDRYKDDPVMQGADRLRADQAAILAIVLAGIKAGDWSDEELLLFLNEPFLTNDNESLNALREKAIDAVRKSGIRLVYSGQKDEVKGIQTVMKQKNIFIPDDCVDYIGPEGITNTVDQTRKIKDYLEKNVKSGEGLIQPLNIQGIRSMRMAKALDMIPENTQAYVYAMPTSPGSQSEEYRKKEVKGTVFYALTGEASFEHSPGKLI